MSTYCAVLNSVNRRRARAIALSFVLGVMADFPSKGWAADVAFSARFQAASNQDTVVITVAPEDTLVLDAGDYFTGGRKLVVSAVAARVVGQVRVGFFPPNARPPVIAGVGALGSGGGGGGNGACGGSGCGGGTGGTGGTGQVGTGGQNATTMLWDIGALSRSDASAKLEIVGAGQAAGQGQKGGKGGTGGPGGEGNKRSCGGLAGLDTRAGPGNGGQAGHGGTGGVGGTGGTGGVGGLVVLSEAMELALRAGALRVVTTGADGGEGGDPGDGGDPGRPGSMGGGNSCGGGGSTGPGNSGGDGGKKGDKGPSGSAAVVKVLTADGGQRVIDPGSLGPPGPPCINSANPQLPCLAPLKD